MTHKKIAHKVRVARALLRDEGVIAVGIRSLELIQKKLPRSNRSSRGRKPLGIESIYDDILSADPSKPANSAWEGIPSTKKSLVFNWLMPPPGRGSGGHMTLFRYIKFLEEAGHTCRIYLHNPGPHSTIQDVLALMGDSFPKVKASIEWLPIGKQMAAADGVFATSWHTAYTVYNSKVKAKKFYFVQDFEPSFYPVGGLSVLAENTYKLGLRGITAGGWLAKKLHDDYGMVTDSFWFGSDYDTYHYNGNDSRKQVVFYARPTTERRAFELGILALDLFHRKHPEYTINFIGWDVSGYAIPFPHKNLGILSPAELNELYNKSSASLVMSLTNMSLLPLELLASGCIPVVTSGENNSLVSDNPYILYSEHDPLSLAHALSEAVTKNNVEYSQELSKSVSGADWTASGRYVVKIVEKSTHSRGGN